MTLLKLIFFPIYLPFAILGFIGKLFFVNDVMNFFDEH